MATIRKTTVVCQLCLRHNDEDIDLIKAVCRDKLNHKSSPRIRVYWDGLRRRLEQVPSGRDPIRPFPANWINRGRRFILCRGSEVCYGEDCYCAHSFEELNYWNSQLDSLSKTHTWLRNEGTELYAARCPLVFKVHVVAQL